MTRENVLSEFDRGFAGGTWVRSVTKTNELLSTGSEIVVDRAHLMSAMLVH